MKGDADIIKGLSHCANTSTDVHKCLDCPFFGDYKDCKDRLIIGANELVRRLTARNERAKKANKKLSEKGNEDIP